MKKRITSLALMFALILTMLATVAPAWAATSSTCTYSIEADKTSASPGEAIHFTIYLQQTGNQNTLQGELKIPAGLTYVSGDLEPGVKDTLGWDAVEWTPSTMMLTGYGSESFTGTEKVAVLNFQCTVDTDAASQDYEVKLIDVEAHDELYETKYPISLPAIVTVTAPSKPATGITLDKTSLALTVGDVETLVATVTPADTTDKVTWASGDDSVASVDAAGKVTAVGVGETTITAKAGSVSATCAVTVEAAPCTHADKTEVPEKASNCTDRGWDAYQTCDDCGALFDSTGNPIAEIPYRALNDDHDFDTTTWGYKGADGHAYVCTRNPDHHDAVVPHTSSGPATEDTAETCTVCGYVISPATGHVCASHLTKVEAKPATCTDEGVVEHYKCSCGKLYWDDDAFDEITDTDELVIDALGHDWAEEWSSDETNHWHACTRCDATTDLHAHNPDHEGGATVDYPILCTDCGYVMEEQLVEGTIRVELPFRLTVQQLDVFRDAVFFARSEGITPAPESSHAISAAMDEARKCKETGESKAILFNLSGHGHLDMSAYMEYFSGNLSNYEYPEQEIAMALSGLPVCDK